MGHDRREKLRLPVEICVQQHLLGDVFLGLTRDLSETGLYLTAPKLSDKWALLGAPMQLEFALPGTGETVVARGQICYETQDGGLKGLGIRLRDMSEQHRQYLRRYVDTVRRARLQNLLWQMNQKPVTLPGVVC